ncbi:peptidylprolyl isomerase [Pyxidicoccus parkwayensis]|uniref:Peptidyl-prolyl cis-trans isomerase n=1 Tax=Pyxidicoccus parkwayensis TaxID=2813578 RepID=A0ABX7P6X7_9BACT|nr:peptidylprolyl isomerase [Pyxidicoccus parkwaysis]QSQ26204.1 peptidylprolyl isomerase [Pyxidicoccus parkwaysis]
MGMMDEAQAGKDLYATFDTTQGTIVVRLFSKDAPKTVASFVGLATGELEFADPKTGEKTRKPFYDGVIFHRVIPGFMIQGGDPTGTGRGGPGFNVPDEYQSGRTFDKVGLLATANIGRPNTNGSQFFITTSKPTYLNNKHTIFGEVITGYDVVEKISNASRDASDRPRQDVRINKLTISTTQP